MYVRLWYAYGRLFIATVLRAMGYRTGVVLLYEQTRYIVESQSVL